MVAVIVLISLREWLLLLARKRVADLRETPPVWLPEYAVAENKALNFLSLLALGLALLKELTGESHLERAQKLACACETEHAKTTTGQIYVETTEQRFKGVRRCC
jgi:carbon starvation protein